MSDFQDDPEAAKKRREAINAPSVNPSTVSKTVEGRIASSIRRDQIQNELTWQSADSARSMMQIDEKLAEIKDLPFGEFTQALKTLLQSSVVSIPDEEIIAHLRHEVREVVGHALKKAAQVKSLIINEIAELQEVLSAADMETLIDEFGMTYLSGLVREMINGFSVQESLEILEPLSELLTIPKEELSMVQESMFLELSSADPITRVIANIETSLQSLIEEFTELLEDTSPLKGTHTKKRLHSIRMKHAALKTKKEEAKRASLIFYCFVLAALLILSLRFMGSTSAMAWSIGVGSGVAIFLVKLSDRPKSIKRTKN